MQLRISHKSHIAKTDSSGYNFVTGSIVDVIGPQYYRIRWNNAKITAITPFTSVSFKVTDFDTNRKHMRLHTVAKYSESNNQEHC